MPEPPAKHDDGLAGEGTAAPERGRLRIFLASAPGAGKTVAMLKEGHERRARGEDVVVAFVETYGRPRTIEAIGDLEVVARKMVPYRGTVLEDMDLDAVLARRPQVALVDELAHTNAPGLSHAKRWQDVEELLQAGVDVLSTVNVQHVESVNDVVERITGITVRETLPDRVLDSADELQFIDISPEALRRRMRHGNIYKPERIETALRNFFRPGNLTALREIGLRFVTQSMTRASVQAEPENVLVAVSGGESSEQLIRRGARLGRRLGGVCMVITIAGPDSTPEQSDRYRQLAQKLGCTYTSLGGLRIDRAIVEAARQAGVTHVVMGESSPPRPFSRWRKTLVDRIVDELPGADVHVIAHARGPAHGDRGDQDRLNPDRLLAGSGTRARLRLHVGYAVGCGTTSVMLQEARRRGERGADVVVAALGGHVRPEVVAGLEILGAPSGAAAHDRLDLEALLVRNPDVACIDDLAGLDVQGEPRYRAVAKILEAGINVIATVHLLSLRSVNELFASTLKHRAPGVLVDDQFIWDADEVELVDVTPTVLLERLHAGEIMSPAEAARAMQSEYRLPVLSALRETAFRVIAEHTDRRLVRYMHRWNIEEPWEAKPRLVALIPPGPGMETVIRRAGDFAASSDADFKVLTVRRRSLSEDQRRWLGEYAALTHSLKGELVALKARSVPDAVAQFVRENLTTEVIVGHRRGRWVPWNSTAAITRQLSEVDMHILRAVAA